MQKKVLIPNLLVCLLVMFACAAPQAKHADKSRSAPTWVTTGIQARYPADLYITGVGSAEIKYNDTAAAQAKADSRALAQVAKQIEVVIQQQTSSLQREVSSLSGETLNQRDVWEKTAAYVNVKVEGAQIEERYHDTAGNRIFSFAVLDRLARGGIISDRISARVSDALSLVAEAERSRKEVSTIHRSLAAYGLASRKMVLAVRENQYLNVIAPTLTHRGMARTLSGLQSEVAGFMSGFTIEKLMGDHQKGFVGGSLTEPLQLRVRYQGRPVPAIPIRFVWVGGSGNIDRHTLSDKQGLAATLVSNLGPTGRKINKIRAVIEVYPGDPHVRNELENVMAPVYAQYPYTLPPVEDVRVVVLIDEYNLGTRQHDSLLKNRLVQSLHSLKLQVVEEIPGDYVPDAYDMSAGPGLAKALQAVSAVADLAVVGQVKATLLDTSAGTSLVFSSSRAVVKIFDLASGRETGSTDMTLKTAGPDRDEAGRRGLEKMSVEASRAVEKELQRILFGR